jgi:hypothetical protein
MRNFYRIISVVLAVFMLNSCTSNGGKKKTVYQPRPPKIYSDRDLRRIKKDAYEAQADIEEFGSTARRCNSNQPFSTPRAFRCKTQECRAEIDSIKSYQRKEARRCERIKVAVAKAKAKIQRYNELKRRGYYY